MPPYIFPQGTFSTYKRGNLTRGILATKSVRVLSSFKLLSSNIYQARNFAQVGILSFGLSNTSLSGVFRAPI